MICLKHWKLVQMETTQQNYNFTNKEVDFINLAVESFINYMQIEDKEKYKRIAEDIIEKLKI